MLKKRTYTDVPWDVYAILAEVDCTVEDRGDLLRKLCREFERSPEAVTKQKSTLSNAQQALVSFFCRRTIELRLVTLAQIEAIPFEIQPVFPRGFVWSANAGD